MGKFSTEGAFYIHLITISFLLMVFTVLKNFNFEEYRDSPELTLMQVKFVYLFLFVGLIGIFLLFIRGYFVKTPEYYTRAGIAMVFIVIGVILILSMLIHDEALGQDQEIGSLEMLGLLFGSLISVVGSIAYISIKFPDDSTMKYFKQAVKEEIRKRGREERQWHVLQAQQRRQIKKQKQKQVRAKKKKSKRPRVEVHEVKMSPPGDIAVVKCAKCKRSLKITSADRPLTIKCPYCEAIGVIKE